MNDIFAGILKQVGIKNTNDSDTDSNGRVHRKQLSPNQKRLDDIAYSLRNSDMREYYDIDPFERATDMA